jgi:hypothetical protein
MMMMMMLMMMLMMIIRLGRELQRSWRQLCAAIPRDEKPSLRRSFDDDDDPVNRLQEPNPIIDRSIRLSIDRSDYRLQEPNPIID